MPTRVPIDGIEPGQFDQLVNFLSDWIASGLIRPVFINPDAVVFEFREREAAANILKSHDLPNSYISQLRVDISLMASGILTGNREMVIRFLAGHADESDKNRQDVEHELKARIDQVEKVVVTPSMARDFATKRTSKGNTLVRATWEVVERMEESSGDTPADLIFAMLSIVYQQPTDASNLGFIPFRVFLDQKNDSMLLTMTASDLEYLSKTLGEAARIMRLRQES